jgi:ribosomal protein S18 acetylase RimI-like enzyme
MAETGQAVPSDGEFALVTLHRAAYTDQDFHQDDLLDGVAGLLVDAVARREALGLLGPLTHADYRKHLDSLAADAAYGNAGLVAAVDSGGEVLATAQWTRSPYATRRVLAELDRVSVAPAARGLGVGRAVVERIVADAAGQGVEVLMLEVRGNNHGAIALYEDCGFARTGLLPNAVADGPARHDVILMCRELPRPDGVQLYGSAVAGSGASELRRDVTPEV